MSVEETEAVPPREQAREYLLLRMRTLRGVEENRLGPETPASRAQIAAMLLRQCGAWEKPEHAGGMFQ